jgi:hypothetical protein
LAVVRTAVLQFKDDPIVVGARKVREGGTRIYKHAVKTQVVSARPDCGLVERDLSHCVESVEVAAIAEGSLHWNFPLLVDFAL